MFDKRWAGLAIIGVSALAMNSAAAMTKVRVHAKDLGHVEPAQMASRLHLRAGNILEAGHSQRLGNAHRLVRMRQLYQGVPVYGRSVVVERARDGRVIRVSGSLEHGLAHELSHTTPHLTPAQARRVLQRDNGQLREKVRGGKAELFIQAGGKDGHAARLIYRVSYLLQGRKRMARPTALVDADTGEIIKKWNGLTYGRRGGGVASSTLVHVLGPGGNAKTGVYYYDDSSPGLEKLWVTHRGNFCYMKNPRVATYDLAGGTTPVLWSFWCPAHDSSGWSSSGDGVNEAYSPINDAHHFAGLTYDMYEDWFNQPPLTTANGSPMQLQMWVHYGTNFDNAFWDGAEMIFGDGNDDDYPVVALDITAHEISHGFTEQHSGLEYVDQSGGMDEAFSDMAGVAVSYFAHGTDGKNFLIGEDIVKPGSGAIGAWRSMCDPVSNGHAIDNAADFVQGMDNHDSSGVYNKAFCTLAKTPGWDVKKAFEVFHDANAFYWGPQATFDSGACGVESAASDRGFSASDVAAAFTVVGVTCQSGSASSGRGNTPASLPGVPTHIPGPTDRPGRGKGERPYSGHR